jgi:hypothetical protein
MLLAQSAWALRFPSDTRRSKKIALLARQARTWMKRKPEDQRKRDVRVRRCLRTLDNMMQPTKKEILLPVPLNSLS